VRRGDLLPLDRVHEVAVAVRAHVQVPQRVGGGDCGSGVACERLEVHDLDGTPGGEHHAANVLAVV
jgi:hypothetical protein